MPHLVFGELMRVAITGSNGFVGSYLTKGLADLSIDVIPLVRGISKQPPASQIVNFSDKNALVEVFSGCDAVIHLIAKTHDNGKHEWNEFIEINLRLSERVAHAAIEAGVKRFVYFSSIKVLGETSTLERPFDQQSAPNPKDFYGKSKLLTERSLNEIFSNSLCTLFIVRPPLIWGGNPKGNLAKILSVAKFGIPLPLGNINNKRHWLSLENLLKFTFQLLTMPRTEPSRIYSPLLICDPNAKSTSLAIKELIEQEGFKARLFSLPAVTWRILAAIPYLSAAVEKLTGSLVIDATETYEAIGWHPVGTTSRSLVTEPNE